jgi:hypothetical protein
LERLCFFLLLLRSPDALRLRLRLLRLLLRLRRLSDASCRSPCPAAACSRGSSAASPMCARDEDERC